MKRKKHNRGPSPAMCLIPQIREPTRKRRKNEYVGEYDSPNNLYKYVSAGNIQNMNNKRIREAPSGSWVGPDTVVALVLVVIWFFFR